MEQLLAVRRGEFAPVHQKAYVWLINSINLSEDLSHCLKALRSRLIIHLLVSETSQPPRLFSSFPEKLHPGSTRPQDQSPSSHGHLPPSSAAPLQSCAQPRQSCKRARAAVGQRGPLEPRAGETNTTTLPPRLLLPCPHALCSQLLLRQLEQPAQFPSQQESPHKVPLKSAADSDRVLLVPVPAER